MAKRTQGMNWIRKDKRLAIYLRDGMACVYCGSGLEDTERLTLDHVVAYEMGGTNSEHNLVTCCLTCNSSKGMRDLNEFSEAVASYYNRDSQKSVLQRVERQTSLKLKPFRAEAKAIMDRRATWGGALSEANGD